MQFSKRFEQGLTFPTPRLQVSGFGWLNQRAMCATFVVRLIRKGLCQASELVCRGQLACRCGPLRSRRALSRPRARPLLRHKRTARRAAHRGTGRSAAGKARQTETSRRSSYLPSFSLKRTLYPGDRLYAASASRARRCVRSPDRERSVRDPVARRAELDPRRPRGVRSPIPRCTPCSGSGA